MKERKIKPEDLDRLQRNMRMDMNWLHGSLNRDKPDPSTRPSVVLKGARIRLLTRKDSLTK